MRLPSRLCRSLSNGSPEITFLTSTFRSTVTDSLVISQHKVSQQQLFFSNNFLNYACSLNAANSSKPRKRVRHVFSIHFCNFCCSCPACYTIFYSRLSCGDAVSGFRHGARDRELVRQRLHADAAPRYVRRGGPRQDIRMRIHQSAIAISSMVAATPPQQGSNSQCQSQFADL